jgi:RNA polymerase sigma-70 factor (ECF subfamily)
MEARIASGDVEAEVIRRARAGDPEAIGWLYDRYYLPIYRYLRVRVEDQEAAEDLAAEVFVRMIEHLPATSPAGAPSLPGSTPSPATC